MNADLLKDLIAANLAAAVAILVMIAGRNPLRRAFGSRVAYRAWLIVPMTALVVFLPAPPAWLALFAPDPVKPAYGPAGVATAAFDWTGTLLGLWLAGAAAGLTAVAVLQHRALRRLKHHAAPGPAVIGVITSRIVLPADFESRYSAEERKVILAHEETHLATGDVRINAAIVFFACLFWFNPLVHLAARLVRADQELACDEAVIARHPEARRTYAEALLKTQISSAPLPLGCYWPERSHKALKERLNMLTLKSPGRGRRIAGAALLAVLGLGTGYVAWAAAPQDPQLPQDQIDEKFDTLLPVDEQVSVEDDGHGNVLITRQLGAQLTNSRAAARAGPASSTQDRSVAIGGETYFATGQTRARAIQRNADGSASPARPDDEWIEFNSVGFRDVPQGVDRTERVESLRFTTLPAPNQGFGARRPVDEKVDVLIGVPEDKVDVFVPVPAPGR